MVGDTDTILVLSWWMSSVERVFKKGKRRDDIDRISDFELCFRRLTPTRFPLSHESQTTPSALLFIDASLSQCRKSGRPNAPMVLTYPLKAWSRSYLARRFYCTMTATIARAAPFESATGKKEAWWSVSSPVIFISS